MFKRLHPAALCVYFACALALTVFSTDPYVAVISLFCAVIDLASFGKLKKGALLAPLFIFLLSALANPLFSHRGETELFFINGNAFTLEALIMGAVTGCTFAAAMLICSCLSAALDDAKLMRLLGSHAPKCALVFTGALRFFPEMLRKHREIEDAQRASGRLPDERPIESLRSRIGIWSSLIGLAFEDAAEQARLISAMGYKENVRRRPVADRGFCVSDAVFIAALLILFSTSILLLFFAQTAFYPVFSAPRELLHIPLYCAAFLLFSLPAIINCFGGLRWLYLKSKI